MQVEHLNRVFLTWLANYEFALTAQAISGNGNEIPLLYGTVSVFSTVDSNCGCTIFSVDVLKFSSGISMSFLPEIWRAQSWLR